MDSGKDQRSWDKYGMNGLTGEGEAKQTPIFLVVVYNFLEIKKPTHDVTDS